MKTTSNRSSHAAGFTLVEILIVLAIVAILSAILFAVVGNVKENGRSTVCQSQLRQLVLAVQQYSQDNDGRYPNFFPQFQLFPYIKSTALIECPTHQARSLAFPEKPSRNLYIWGYLYNGVQLADKAKNGSRLSFSGQHEVNLVSPSTTWVFADNVPFEATGGGGAAFLAYSQCGMGGIFWPSIHRDGANYAFLDGHVKWLTPVGIDKLACPTDAEN